MPRISTICWQKLCPNQTRIRDAIIIFRQHKDAVHLEQLEQIIQAIGYDLDPNQRVRGDGLNIDDY